LSYQQVGDGLLTNHECAAWDRLPKSLVAAKPAIILRWRPEGIWKCGRRGEATRQPGRPEIDAELVSLIGQVSWSNSLWGAPRIHGEMLKLAEAAQVLGIDQATLYRKRKKMGLD